MSEPATREELNALGDSLRKAIESDRAERIETLTRMETKIDSRLEALFTMLSDHKDKTSDLHARVNVLEAGMQAHLEDAQRNFRAISDSFNLRITDHQTFYNNQLASVKGKQDRNWGWIMAIFGSVAMALITALLSIYFSKR